MSTSAYMYHLKYYFTLYIDIICRIKFEYENETCGDSSSSSFGRPCVTFVGDLGSESDWAGLHGVGAPAVDLGCRRAWTVIGRTRGEEVT